MVTVKQMLDMCRSYIGTQGGKNYYNIFAKELDSVEYYKPQKKQNVYYCSIFLDDMSYKLIKDVNKTHDWLYQPHTYDLSASATYQMNYFKKAKRFYTMPQPGDWAFLRKTSTEAKHVCIVESVGVNTITTIDANHGNKVCRVVRNKSEYLGYGRPIYKEDKGGTVMVEMPVIKKGSHCNEVGTFQTLLKAKGFKGADGKVLAIDNHWGNNTDYACANFQSKNGLTPDKICGKGTWNKILKG